jgi:hypothetical protein
MRQVSLVGKNANPNDNFGGLDASNRATGNQADEGAKAVQRQAVSSVV